MIELYEALPQLAGLAMPQNHIDVCGLNGFSM